MIPACAQFKNTFTKNTQNIAASRAQIDLILKIHSHKPELRWAIKDPKFVLLIIKSYFTDRIGGNHKR